MQPLRVLITSFRFALRSGLEVYAHDLAVALQERGHVPIVYSPELGELATQLRWRTIPVVDDLNAIGAPPDIIHGHHHLETMTALLHFPRVPAIYYCHDWFSGLDSPPSFPRILRYAAVDQPCLEKLVFEHGVPETRVRLLPNFIDGARFKPRSSLPARPRRALLYCNYTSEDANLAAVRQACARSGLELDVVGLRMGNACADPENLLGNYDIVFAKAKSAAEALATGAATIIYCLRSVGSMVTTSEFDHLLMQNFGLRAMTHHLHQESLMQALEREIARYDAQDAAAVSQRARILLDKGKAIDEILSLYREVIDEYKNSEAADVETETRAAAAYIHWLSSRVKGQFNLATNSVVQHPTAGAAKRPLENVWSNPAVINLKRRFVKIPLIGKWVHSFALRLIGPPA